jgi:ABC-type Fe3+/spermidine/putrescine transport system ATPase subunit
MDEPLRHLSREYRSRARTFLEQISADLGVQFILVTHDPGLAAGTVVRLA